MRVWVNGTFDVLHLGHIRLLKYAASLGELRVGIDTDQRVKRLKGESRPINNIFDRMFYLRNLKAVDYVLYFDSDLDLEKCITWSGATIMVKGSDYRGKSITGSQYCEDIKFFNLVQNYSTSKIIEDINNPIQHDHKTFLKGKTKIKCKTFFVCNRQLL